MVRLSKKERTGYFIIFLLLILIFAVISVVVFVMNSIQNVDVIDEKGNLVGKASIFVIKSGSGFGYKQALRGSSLILRLSNGAACTINSRCRSQLCINSICRPSNVAQGGQCIWTEQCQAAFYCQKALGSTAGTCTPKFLPGSSCSQDDQCVSGYNCGRETCNEYKATTCIAADIYLDCGAY